MKTFKFPSEGTDSPLDRINVRRMLQYLEQSIQDSIEEGFANDSDEIRLPKVTLPDGTTYQDVINTRNNTLDRYVKPVTAAEFITINVTITKEGAVLETPEYQCKHEYDTSCQLMCNPPKYACKKCGATIYVHAYNLLQLVKDN